MCPTDDIEVNISKASDKCQPLKCEYICCYCGYVINSQAIFKCIKLNVVKLSLFPEILSVTQDTVSYSFPVLPPFQPLSSYPLSFTLPLEKCFTCNKEFRDKSKLREHLDSCHPDFIFFWCNICLADFRSDRGLKSHMRNQHKLVS